MFEAPHRIEAALSDMAAAFPTRRLTLARELTKTFETFLSGTVVEIQTALREDHDQTRGEMVLILHPAAPEKNTDLPAEALRVLDILAAELPTKQAAELAARITGANKKPSTMPRWRTKTAEAALSDGLCPPQRPYRLKCRLFPLQAV